MSFPLQDVRILELGQIIAGTYGCQILSDLGAEVIKIESPGGDLGRIPSVAPVNGLSGLFLTYNRNKKSMVIDLKSQDGRELFYSLVRKADIVIDNFRPGVLKRLEVDYETLKAVNPRIIQCSVTGFGSSGEYSNLPALDIIIQSISGHMSITGEEGQPPVRTGIPLADLSGGIFSCKGLLAALYEREKTGAGRRLEISMFDGMLNLLSYIATVRLSGGDLPVRQGSAHEFTVPWEAFPTSDGFLVIACRQDNFWQQLCEALERPDLAADKRFTTNGLRVENRVILVPILREILKEKSTADWLQLMRAHDVPAAPVNDIDGAFAEPPVAERQMIVSYDHPEAGPIRLPGNPIKFDGTPETISEPAPLLGEHTDLLLQEILELKTDEIADLKARGIVA